MSGYKKEISLAVIVGAIAALGIGLFAISAFPPGPTSTPKLLLGILSTQPGACSLATGVCNVTIVNSGPSPSYDVIATNDCSQSVILSSNGTNTTWHIVSGTAAGQATVGIPAGSKVVGTCTISTSELVHQPQGSFASGCFTVKLVNRLYSYPAGSETSVCFEGTWT